jgi:hypothetical protein
MPGLALDLHGHFDIGQSIFHLRDVILQLLRRGRHDSHQLQSTALECLEDGTAKTHSNLSTSLYLYGPLVQSLFWRERQVQGLI